MNQSQPVNYCSTQRSEVNTKKEYLADYDTFKSSLLDIRSRIKRDCTEDELYEFQEVLEVQYRKLVC